MRRVLDWVDARPDWTFFGVLYLARWVCVGAVWPLQMVLVTRIYQGEQPDLLQENMDHLAVLVVLFFLLLIAAPLVETLFECALPHWVFSKFRAMPARPWGFIMVATLLMTVLHPIATAPATVVTGAFLGYCYAHYAPSSRLRAILFTTLFHAGINAVGFLLLALSLL